MKKISYVLIALGTALTSLASPAQTRPDHDVLARSFFFHAQIGKGKDLVAVKSPLVLPTIMKATSLDQLVDAPKGLGPIRVVRFIPAATLKQKVRVPTDSEKAGSAIELGIIGRKQSYRRWLVANDPRRDRLSSLIGNWRLIEARTQAELDTLRASYEHERYGHLRIQRSPKGPVISLLARPGSKTSLSRDGVDIEILEFFPHFDFDDHHKPRTRSGRNLNPAALIRLRDGDLVEERFVFARDFDISRNESRRVSLQVRLDCPISDAKTPASFILVHRPNGTVGLWSSDDAPSLKKTIAPDQSVRIPRSNYVFQILRHEPRAIIEDQWVEDPKGRDTVMQIELTEPTQKRVTSHWLRLGKPLHLKTPKGLMTVLFARKQDG